MLRLSNEEQLLLLDLLKVLYKHSDYQAGKHLSQKEIIELLGDKYDNDHLYEKRGTIKDNLEKLIYYLESNQTVDTQIDAYGQEDQSGKILYDARFRNIPNPEAKKNKQAPKTKEIAVLYNFAYHHLFSHEELRLIIDSILFSRQIPSEQREGLIKKLEKVTSKHFNSRLGNIRTMQTRGPINDELFDNIRVLDEAISQSKQVTFKYNHYTVNEANQLVLEARKNEAGEERTYIINPYQMVATNGRYYLICNYDYFDDLSHYRLDRITDIKIGETKRKPLRKLKAVGDRIDLARYMAEHIYMFGGESVSVSLRIQKGAIGEFIDWFGTDQIDFSNQREEDVTVGVKVNREAMRKWALQYGLYVTVLSPSDLVEDIKKDITRVMENYE